MNLSLAISVAVMIAGLIMYLLAAPPKPQEIGRLMFFAGLLAALLKFAGEASLRIG